VQLQIYPIGGPDMIHTKLKLPPTIIDLIFGQNLASSVVFVAAGAAVTALAAQFVVPLYLVPVTAQTLAVLVVGMALGAVRGAAAMILYIALGAVGLPVFSDTASGVAVLLGPRGGYIVGFVVSAALVGFLAERNWDRTFARAFAAASIATSSTFTIGVIGLSFALQSTGSKTNFWGLLQLGVTPFLLGEGLKIVLVSALFSQSWKVILRESPIRPVSG
jgi:biotin transport system substrate-specific component